MAINPPLNQLKEPQQLQCEYFILSREYINFEIIISDIGILKATGKGYLTTNRLILVNMNKNKDDVFEAFDIPLKFVFEEEVMQTSIGKEYL